MDSDTSVNVVVVLILCLGVGWAISRDEGTSNEPLKGTTAFVLKVGGCDRTGMCRVVLEVAKYTCTTTRDSAEYMEGFDYKHMPIEGEQVCVVEK